MRVAGGPRRRRREVGDGGAKGGERQVAAIQKWRVGGDAAGGGKRGPRRRRRGWVTGRGSRRIAAERSVADQGGRPVRVCGESQEIAASPTRVGGRSAFTASHSRSRRRRPGWAAGPRLRRVTACRGVVAEMGQRQMCTISCHICCHPIFFFLVIISFFLPPPWTDGHHGTPAAR